jgi:DNA repair protein RadC
MSTSDVARERLRVLLDRAADPQLLTDAECLGLLLRRGAGPAAVGLAERLLPGFGSLPELLGAEPEALARAAPAAAVRDLRLLHDLQRRTLAAPLKARPALGTLGLAADYVRTVLAGRRREQFRVLFLDRRHRLLADEVLGEGTVDHAPVYPREVLRRALELGASGLVMAHNHPGGDPAPSAADIEATRAVAHAGRVLRIVLHDHLLVADGQVVSFRRLGALA